MGNARSGICLWKRGSIIMFIFITGILCVRYNNGSQKCEVCCKNEPHEVCCKNEPHEVCWNKGKSKDIRCKDECIKACKGVLNDSNQPRNSESKCPNRLKKICLRLLCLCEDFENEILEMHEEYNVFKTKEIPRKQPLSLIANSSWVGKRTTDNQDADVEVILPAELSEIAEEQQNDHSRLIFSVFNNNKLFWDEDNSTLLNDQVFEITMGNTSIQNLTEGVIIKINHISTVKNYSHRCAFWLEDETDSESWDFVGCNTTVEVNQTICVCNHLTFFAVLLDLRLDNNTLNEKDVISLTYITVIGCAISAVFSAITIFLYCVIRRNKGDHTTQIHINLCIACFLLNMNFLTNEWISKLMIDGLCKTIAVLLHYSLLCTFTWMAIEGLHLYVMLIKVFNIYVNRYILKLALMGWGIPAVVVSLCIAVNKNNYGQFQIKMQDNNSSISMCWITNNIVHYVTNCGFLGMIWLWNLTMLITVCVKLAQTRKGISSVSRSVWKDLWSVLGLSSLLGITWALPLILHGPMYVVQTYLFCILNSLQGFFIFLWYCTIKLPSKEQSTNYTSDK